MSLLVTGSVGIDTVESPAGKIVDTLGGSATYFSYAASFFVPVRMVGVVGDDCPPDFLLPLERNKRIDLSGVEVRSGSRTFRWHGKYLDDDLNQRQTLSVQLNVLGEAGPPIPPGFRDSRYVFLANTNPVQQLELLEQLDGPQLVVADTMDLWIETAQEPLRELLGRIDGLVLNDSEAKMLARQNNVIAAGMAIAPLVRGFVVVKKGEHGGLLFLDGSVYPLAGFPAHEVVDPTGAGDCFAGGMMGYLAAEGRVDDVTLRRAIAYGTVVASIELEDFSLNRLMRTTRQEIDDRLERFGKLIAF